MLCWSRWRWSSGMSPTRSWPAATPRASSSSGSSTRGGELWLVETRSRDQMLTSDWPRWSIELINDRSTPVTSFCWSHDGRMALICYQVQLQISIISTQQHVDYRYISIISTQQHVVCCRLLTIYRSLSRSVKHEYLHKISIFWSLHKFGLYNFALENQCVGCPAKILSQSVLTLSGSHFHCVPALGSQREC